MSKAKFSQETRDFIESVFQHNNYSLERQIQYLEIAERQKYHYYCDCSWACDRDYDNAWNEIIEMLHERKTALQDCMEEARNE